MSDPRDSLFSTPAMIAAFAAEAQVRKMLDFEAALARSEAGAGVIPPAAAAAIEAACRADDFDLVAIYRETAVAGTPVIPLLRVLTARIAHESRDYVHWGATSQDVIDTATVLQMRDGLILLEADLLRLGVACAALAGEHRRTVMAGRTLLQQALPISFGLKAARWLGLVTRQVRALRGVRGSLALQFGGAAGTLAFLADNGLRVAALLARDLALELPDLPWHAERDRIGAVAAALGLAAGAMGKIALDVVLLAQTEIGEMREAPAPGKGESSTMPQKRNPVDATMAMAAARLAIGEVPVILGAMAQEHERGAGGWQAEWTALPALFRYTGGAVSHAAGAVEGLLVDASRMRANLDTGGGLLMAEALTVALTPHIGRREAQRVVQVTCARAVEEGSTLLQVAGADAKIAGVLSPEQLEDALNPVLYLGSADALIDRALESYRSIGEEHDSAANDV